MTAVLVALGGAFGAMLRYAIDRAMTAAALRRGAGARMVPWGIALVNLSGSFVLGVLVGAGWAWQPLSVGLLGGFTTFSTASLDAVRLYREKRYVAATLYALGTLVAAALLATAGIMLGAELGAGHSAVPAIPALPVPVP